MNAEKLFNIEHGGFVQGMLRFCTINTENFILLTLRIGTVNTENIHETIYMFVPPKGR